VIYVVEKNFFWFEVNVGTGEKLFWKCAEGKIKAKLAL
jgi:hypothetical protein